MFIFNKYRIKSNFIQNMITLKLKYRLKDEQDMSLILDYQIQYSSCLHFLYNRISDNPSITEKELRLLYDNINNCSLISKWLFQCAIKEARQIYNSHGAKVIFGGKSNYIKRNKLSITKEEYKAKRISPVYSIGEADKLGNRMFRLKPGNILTFQPDRLHHIDLELVGLRKHRQNIVSKLTELANQKKVTITYKLSNEYVWISYDEKTVINIETPKIKNRVFAIDMNPNYVGWSIVDWKSSSKFRIVKEGIISIKELNDYDNKQKIDSIRRKHISNIRHHAIIEICKNLVDTAAYYRCDKFILEDLKFNTNERNSKFNRLTKNQWCRDLLEMNITKRCNIYNINIIKVKPEYSSFVGNFIFRHVTNMPDMVLASIEIGRRGYEYSSQYIDKTKNKKKNIVLPDISYFDDLYTKSLEEFSIEEKLDNLLVLYSYIKNAKMTYRVPISDKLIGFRLRSLNRFVYTINNFI